MSHERLRDVLGRPPIGHVASRSMSVPPMTLEASLKMWQDRLRPPDARQRRLRVDRENRFLDGVLAGVASALLVFGFYVVWRGHL